MCRGWKTAASLRPSLWRTGDKQKIVLNISLSWDCFIRVLKRMLKWCHLVTNPTFFKATLKHVYLPANKAWLLEIWDKLYCFLIDIGFEAIHNNPWLWQRYTKFIQSCFLFNLVAMSVWCTELVGLSATKYTNNEFKRANHWHYNKHIGH